LEIHWAEREGESGALAAFSPSEPHLLAAGLSATVPAACPPVCCCGFSPAPALRSGWAVRAVPCFPAFQSDTSISSSSKYALD